MHALRWRTRAFDFRGIPELPRLVAHFFSLRTTSWARQQGHPSGMLYRLPSDRRDPTVTDVRHWFGIARANLEIKDLTHHSVRSTGASSAFCILVPIQHIKDWGWWTSDAVWTYINRQRQPTRADFLLFGWMIMAADHVRQAVASVFVPVE